MSELVVSTSPFWTANPMTDMANTNDMRELIGINEQNTLSVYTAGVGTMPAIEPGAFADPDTLPEAYLLPHPFLPDIIWTRHPHESMPSYQLRQAWTLHMLDLLDYDEDAALPAMQKENVDTLERWREAWWTGGEDGMPDGYRQRRERLHSLVEGAWPDGYPLDTLLAFSWQMAPLCQILSMTVILHNVCVLSDNGDGEMAKSLLGYAHRLYPTSGLAGEVRDMGEAREWVEAKREGAWRILAQMEESLMEPPGTADTVREWMR